MSIYIAYRNLKVHFSQNNGCGGVPYNNDYCFTTTKNGGNYLLTIDHNNYSVSKEDGEQFISDVLSKCTGEHRGLFPLCPSYNGKETAAVIEVTREVEKHGFTTNEYVYCDMDDEVLLQMLEDLRSRSGEPLDQRALINYCYPNAELPEGDFDLSYIYHGIYCKEEPRPAATIQTFFPDKRGSHFWINKDSLFVEIREDNTETTYKVPSEMLPEIKEKVRELCREPAEAYVEHGDWEGYIRFEEDEKRIFTDPDKTFALLKEISSKGVLESSNEVDLRKYYPVSKAPAGGFPGFGMNGFMSLQGLMGMAAESPAETPAVPSSPAASSSPADANRCLYCGADVTGKKFCTECGGKVEQP